MIGIYKDSTGSDDARLPMSYGGLTFNQPDGKIAVAVAVVQPAWDYVSEPRQDMDGMEVYQPRRMRTMIRLDGVLKGETLAELHDLIEQINAAFDPVMNWINDDDYDDYVPTQDRGYTPFGFSVPTEDTTNFPTGLIDLRYFARARSLPVDRTSKFEGTSARWTVDLEAADPRRYLLTERSEDLSNNGTLELSNPLATYPSWPHLRMESIFGPPPTGDLTIELDGKTITLDIDEISLNPGVDVIEVNLRQQIVTLNDDERMDLLVPGSEWFMVPPGDSELIIGGTADFNTEIVWYPARV